MYFSKRVIVLSLASLLCAVSAFSQSDVSVGSASQMGDGSAPQVGQGPQTPATTMFPDSASDHSTDESMTATGGGHAGALKNQSSLGRLRDSSLNNRDIYYRNKLEFSLDGGWLPINIPFPLDIFVGDNYNTYPLKYTLVPIFASLRWQIDGIEAPSILRGNWDMTLTGSVTAIPRGPESRYFSYIMGIRRNFVPRRGPVAPYFDVRLGLGNIDAKGPKGVLYAQGQDLTFTVNMGSGIRYNFNPRYALSAGLNFMHISNLDLSESNGKPYWGVRNYGINVYGPMVGIDIQLGRHPRHAGQ